MIIDIGNGVLVYYILNAVVYQNEFLLLSVNPNLHQTVDWRYHDEGLQLVTISKLFSRELDCWPQEKYVPCGRIEDMPVQLSDDVWPVSLAHVWPYICHRDS